MLAGAAALAAPLALLAAGNVEAQQGALPVGTVYAQRKPVSQMLDFVGRIDAIDKVEVRARVKGYLEKVLFKEGERVTKGEPLYQIEKGLFQAAVEQAQGALERSKAAKTLTAIQLQRAQDLLKTNAGTAVARDQALAADQSAEAQITSDQGSLDTANINLGYTDIVSPIDGKISKTNITAGNVVGPDSGVLTTIVSEDPMYVTFPVSQREFLRVQERGQQLDLKNIKIKLRFADGSTYKETGTVDFVDVSVDRATDTVLVRATIPNPDDTLIDGQFVRVAVEAGAPEEKVVVPQAALLADQEGVYVFVVEDGKAAVKRIKPAGDLGPDVIVSDGLKGGEQVIVEGLQSLRPGLPVQASPLPATLNQG